MMIVKRATLLSAAMTAVGFTSGCVAQPASAPSATVSAPSILAGSSPAAGSTVQEPVNALQLHFNPPARLGAVTVAGPDGTMPMMVTAVGEVRDYSVPVAGLAAGRYTVNWKATNSGREYQGSFAFTVK